MNASSETADERALVRAFLDERTEAAFRGLYRLHTEALYRVAVRLLRGRRDDAEDVVQEAWVRAVRQLPSFRWQSSLRSWLTGIAVNCARERLRSELREEEGRRVAVERAAELAAAEDEPSLDAVPRDELVRAIEALPAGYREVLVLHDVEGHSHEVTAEMLGVAVGTSKSQLSRARRSLRRALAGSVEKEGRRDV